MKGKKDDDDPQRPAKRLSSSLVSTPRPPDPRASAPGRARALLAAAEISSGGRVRSKAMEEERAGERVSGLAIEVLRTFRSFHPLSSFTLPPFAELPNSYPNGKKRGKVVKGCVLALSGRGRGAALAEVNRRKQENECADERAAPLCHRDRS